MIDIHVAKKPIPLALIPLHRSVGPFRLEISSQVPDVLEERHDCWFRMKTEDHRNIRTWIWCSNPLSRYEGGLGS